MESALRIERSMDGGMSILSLQGEIKSQDDKKHLIDNVCEELDHNHSNIALDFTNFRTDLKIAVGFLSPLKKKLQDAGGIMILVSVEEQLHQTFKLADLDGLFNFAPTLEQARLGFRDLEVRDF